MPLSKFPSDIDTSLHGTYRHHAKQRLAEGFYRESMICQEHRFDNLLHDTCEQPLSDLKLAEQVIPFFKTMHALERYGKLEPEPSTFICPTCLDDQGSKDDFDHHVVACSPMLSTRTLSLIERAIFNPRWLFRVPGNRRPRRRAARILQTCTNLVDMFFRMLITAKSAISLPANHWPSSLDTRLLTHGATTSLLTTD